MRVLICPDKFAGTLSAPAAAAALADGWRSVAPDDTVTVRPLADGGPGFVAALAASCDGRAVPVATVDPLGHPAQGEVLLVTDGPPPVPGGPAPTAAAPVAYVESAQACGLHLVPPEERDPRVATSYGLGALLTAAVEAGARQVVVGLGGSGVNDGGAGMFTALGATPLDEAGYALPYGAGPLLAVDALDGAPQLRDATLVAATDVDNPLLGPDGASAVFGPQKGARTEDVAALDAALGRFAAVLERDLPGCPPELAAHPGAGAAGGLGAALLALGAHRVSGIALVRRLTGLDDAFAEADLVVTGEGSFDDQSLRGKVVAGVAEAAQAHGVGAAVVAGRVDVTAELAREAGVVTIRSLVDHFAGDVEEAMTRTAAGLSALGAELARQWHPAEG